MLDIKFIRQNPDKVKEYCKRKQIKVDIDYLLELDKKRRILLQAFEDMRAKKNQTSEEIAKVKDEKEKQKLILQMKELDRNNDRLAVNLKEIERVFNELILKVPNIPLEDVPIGKDESGNIVLREVGEKPNFCFPIKDYLKLGKNLDLIDVERAAKISGTRFGFLKKEAVLIEFALINFTLDNLLGEKFIPILPPVILKKEMARGTGYFEAVDEKEAYFIPQDNFYLSGTTEQPLIAMHSGEIFEEKELPRRYLGFSSCFRREAGAWGKDTKGIFRVHQFDQLEMISFSKPEDSRKEHQFFLEIEEKLMCLLEIPYRVVQICTGDLGFPAAAKYDIEAWFPSQNRYRETHSTSNCTDFQARRLNIRYRNSETKKLGFVHTINGTAFAIGRIIIAIMENYQQNDGSIKIPQALRKYLKFEAIRQKK